LAQGRIAGVASIGGVALGNLGNVLVAALGLGALFAVSPMAFIVVKYAGAAYLLYLGVAALRRRAEAGSSAMSEAAAAKVFRDSFLVALLNPKTALFFVAFLPQFLPAASASVLQVIVLGLIFVVVAAAVDLVYVLAAALALPLLGGPRATRAGRYLTAGSFIALACFTAFIRA
jgi:threonine/homoserine/homoserine lactone efflux protein